MSTKKYKVGDTLFWVSGLVGLNKEVTIDRVGRKWLYSGRYRIDAETLVASTEGYGTVARCYPDKTTYEAIVAQQVEWVKLKRATHDRYSPPAHLTTEQITSMLQMIEKGGSA
ncbi:hypothetical protein Acf1_00014 [Acidovorax phage ACF1]|nr:hypothetical protein Acf1_00014 [Acidovorax phage ACF1]